MCGISGVVVRTPERAQGSLRAMTDAQTHRGPDDSGQHVVDFSTSAVGFGHRRLSIIDLSPLGHQPMIHPTTGDLLVFNGEIYNFRTLRAELERDGEIFKGHSDTEVMLHALVRHGPSVISRFEGMFAFAWLRRADRKLVLARDHVGIKPLYVAWTKDAFCFASEVRAILASGLVDTSLSPRGLATVLAFGAVQEPDTIFHAVRTFPAGCWQEFDIDQVLSVEPGAPRRFWSPPKVDPSIDEERALDITRRELDRSIAEHLVADVDVGVFLSSGIDSTLIAGLAARHQRGIRAYTVGFADNADMSESPAAAETARAFGLPHVDVQIRTSDALDSVGRWLSSMDQPSMDGLNTYVVSQAVRQTGLKVALSGLGGDELFAGYPSFEDVPRLKRIMDALRSVPKPARGIVARLASIGKSQAYRQKLIEIVRTDGRLLELYFQRRRTMSDTQLASLGINAAAAGLSAVMIPPEALFGLELDESAPVAGVSQLETRFYAGNMLLRDSDACGMAHGLEIRVPFFDRRVIEGAMSFPDAVRVPAGRAEKHLLRRAFPDLLRPELLALKKRGFTLPISRWMSTSLRPFCEAAIANVKSCGMLDPRGIDQVWNGFLRQPTSQAWSRAFTLCVLGSYLGSTRGRMIPTITGATGPTPTGFALRLQSSSVA